VRDCWYSTCSFSSKLLEACASPTALAVTSVLIPPATETSRRLPRSLLRGLPSASTLSHSAHPVASTMERGRVWCPVPPSAGRDSALCKPCRNALALDLAWWRRRKRAHSELGSPPCRLSSACDDEACHKLEVPCQSADGAKSGLFWGGEVDHAGNGVAEHVRRVAQQVILNDDSAEVWRGRLAGASSN
jgi:hypothetical protein